MRAARGASESNLTTSTQFYGWKLLGVFWLMVFINLGFPVYGSAVINAAMAVALGFDRKTLGLVFSVYMSTERVIVDEKVADEFAQKLAKRVSGLPVGDPNKGEVVIGSVVGKPTVERVERLVKDAVSKGAKVLIGGESNGTVMQGIVVDRVTPQMQLFREESFGPQVSITRVKSVDEAVELANDTEYGLSAAVFGKNLARALDVARRIDSGICHVNGPTVHDEAHMDSLPMYVEAQRTALKLASSAQHFIPGHDPLVLVRYPGARAGLEGVARVDLAPRS